MKKKLGNLLVKFMDFLPEPSDESHTSRSLYLMKQATHWEEVAKKYDSSNPYRAGEASGRAQILRVWSEEERERDSW